MGIEAPAMARAGHTDAAFMAGALAVIRYAKIHGTEHRPWLTALLARRPSKFAAIALANKIARMVWVLMARGERYKEPIALAA
jgi:transposase